MNLTINIDCGFWSVAARLPPRKQGLRIPHRHEHVTGFGYYKPLERTHA